MNTSLIPTEEQEQQAFVQWCQINDIVVHHSPNEGSGSRQAAIRGARMKRLGTSKGFWDLMLFIPVHSLVDGEIDDYQIVMVEMKRKRGGSVSPEQKEWQKIYETAGIPCKVCKGADEAIDFVKEYML